MEAFQHVIRVSVVWRGNKYVVEMGSDASLKKLGDELQKLSGVKQETLRLIVPQLSNKGPRLLSPFSEAHSHIRLQEASITEGKSIRMMGVSGKEIDSVLNNAKADLRIAGFDEEDRRLRQRMYHASDAYVRLPRGPYIFCDFRTLKIPGMELNPPPSLALKRMHMLAADPGIVAIMNKYRWRVGIMTEMAPIGYVGVSPKCLLGFNKNRGEEISLRLRTDDLKGFRKYGSIKKTLLHELAHMVYTEHDENFYTLDKKLNQEAASLDWTKSTGHTLSGQRHFENAQEQYDFVGVENYSHQLGGSKSDQLASARETSVTAAYRRLANRTISQEVHKHPDPDDLSFEISSESENVTSAMDQDANDPRRAFSGSQRELDPDDHFGCQSKLEPDPDDFSVDYNEWEPYPLDHSGGENKCEPDPDDHSGSQKLEPDPDDHSGSQKLEPDPDDRSGSQKLEPDPDDHSGYQKLEPDSHDTIDINMLEPDPDDSPDILKRSAASGPEAIMTFESHLKPNRISDALDPYENAARKANNMGCENMGRCDDNLRNKATAGVSRMQQPHNGPDHDEKTQLDSVRTEPDPDCMAHAAGISSMKIDEQDPNDQELRRIQDSATAVCSRLQKAVEMLQAEVSPTQRVTVLQTLSKIIRNVIENPNEIKFKKIRKGNPLIQRTIVSFKAAIEILFMVGFVEDVVSDEIGKPETYLVLKRNDPGLLWLVKSSIETCMAH